MALILSAVMLASCVTTALLAAHRNWKDPGLGALSQYYETGENADPGAVSTVPDDPGGTSFGLYMFASKVGTVDDFRRWLRSHSSALYRDFGERLDQAYGTNLSGGSQAGYGPNFQRTWAEIGHGANGKEFGNAQTEYWGSVRYEKLIERLESTYRSFDLNNYSIALQNVLWSRSVHHGVDGAYNVVTRAIDGRLGGFANQSEAELIAAIYAECSKLNNQYSDMTTQLSDRYGVKGRSMAYFSKAGDDVQSSVYSRLHINEPADALVMRYQNTTAPLEGKYQILYLSNQKFGYAVNEGNLVDSAKASALTLTYYNSGRYTLTAEDGKRLAVVNGALMLQNPSADASQLWTLTSSSNGYVLYNVGAKLYLTITVSTTEIPDTPAPSEPTEEETVARNKRVEELVAALNSDDENALDEETAALFVTMLTEKIEALVTEHLEGKEETEIKADLAKMEDVQRRMEELEETLPENAEAITKEQAAEMEELQKEYLELIKSFTGKSLDEIILIVAGELVDKQIADEKAAASTTTTVTAYKVGLSADAKAATLMAVTPVTGQDSWSTVGLFYPQMPETDDFGTKIVHNLTEGNSSFPIRGIVTCTQGIGTVKAVVTNAGGAVATSSSGNAGGAKWFDLWELDSALTISKLPQGKYTFTLTGTNSTGTYTLVNKTFTIGAATTTTPEAPDNKYVVQFVVNGKVVDTRTYSEAQPYGALPSVSESGFQGWFYSDREISQSTPVAPRNHTVTAKFGTLHTVSFKYDNTVWDSYKLAQNDIIRIPTTNPIKAADKSYTYSFSYWKDSATGAKLASGTLMPDSDVTYVAVFSKTANSGGGGTGGGGTGGGGGGGGTAPVTPSGSYLTGISPNTSVSSLTASGYTVYNGSKQVTSGLVGTGMTAVSSGGSVTIVVTGDVSGDGKVTITDVVKLQKSVVGSASLTGAYAKAGDISGDGKITITDVVQAAQVTVGQRTIN